MTMTAAQRYGQPQLQRRQFAARAQAAGQGAREVFGTAVPWDQEEEIFPGFRESWAPGAAESPEDGTKLFWLHTHPIGRLTEASDGATGWDVTARVSRTPQGDEALTLAEDGVITRMSVGFRALEWEETTDEDDTVHVRITRAEVLEVSLVPFPAYSGAAIAGTRADTTTNPPSTTHTQEEIPMPETTAPAAPAADESTAEQLRTLTTDVAEVRQVLATLPADLATATGATPPVAFRSIGEYAKALASGDSRATDLFTRAVTTDDTITAKSTSWVGDTIKIIQARQRILRLFTHLYNLPSTGMTVEHGVLVSNTIDVAEQVNQGDNLVYGEVKLGQESAPVKTFGGYTEVPRQVIERSSVEYLDFVFQAFAAAYGKAMEAYARAVLEAGYVAQAADAATTVEAGTTLAAATDLTWLSVILDADEMLDDAGHALQGLLVGKDVLLAMAAIESTDRMLRWAPNTSPGGTNAAGTLYVRRGGPSADVMGIEVNVNPAWKNTPGRAMAYDPFALVTREQPGAPVRLQDENIVNLTKQFSVYGYATSYVQAQNALVPITFTA